MCQTNNRNTHCHGIVDLNLGTEMRPMNHHDEVCDEFYLPLYECMPYMNVVPWVGSVFTLG